MDRYDMRMYEAQYVENLVIRGISNKYKYLQILKNNLKKRAEKLE